MGKDNKSGTHFPNILFHFPENNISASRDKKTGEREREGKNQLKLQEERETQN